MGIKTAIQNGFQWLHIAKVRKDKIVVNNDQIFGHVQQAIQNDPEKIKSVEDVIDLIKHLELDNILSKADAESLFASIH